MGNSLSQQDEEGLYLKLFEQLKAIDFEQIQKDADKAVDEELKNPATAEKFEKVGATFDQLHKSVSDDMADTIKGMTVLVAEKVRREHPELADEAEEVLNKIDNYEIPEERLEEIKEYVAAAKGNLGQLYGERMRSMVHEAIGDLKGQITEQFNAKVQEKAVEADVKYDAAVVRHAGMLMQMHNSGGPTAVNALLPTFQALGEQGQQTVELFNKNLVEAGEQPYETQAAPATGGMAPQ